jgi:hypothetical protein
MFVHVYACMQSFEIRVLVCAYVCVCVCACMGARVHVFGGYTDHTYACTYPYAEWLMLSCKHVRVCVYTYASLPKETQLPQKTAKSTQQPTKTTK